jgi:hypothetical protein
MMAGSVATLALLKRGASAGGDAHLDSGNFWLKTWTRGASNLSASMSVVYSSMPEKALILKAHREKVMRNATRCLDDLQVRAAFQIEHLTDRRERPDGGNILQARLPLARGRNNERMNFGNGSRRKGLRRHDIAIHLCGLCVGGSVRLWMSVGLMMTKISIA